MERSLTHRHSRNRSYLFFSGWLACENHWNLRVVSPTPHLYPQQKCPILIQNLKKKKVCVCVCVCVCIYIYIYEQLRNELPVFILTLTVLLTLCLGYTIYLKLWGNCSLLSGLCLSGKKFSLCGWEITRGSWNTFFEKMISESSA